MTSEAPTAPLGPVAEPERPGLPQLADGVELAGEFVGAGYREPPLLVYRGDGQVVRLPELLYQTVRALEECHRFGDPAAGRRSYTDREWLLEAVAGALSVQADREYAAEHVEFMLDHKLAPLGVTTFSDGTPPELVKPQPILSLTCRMTMLSERATWFLAGLFTWLFSKPVLAAMIPLILGAVSWTLITQPVAGAVEVTIASPGNILLVVALAIASTGFHEIGHGTACRYGGVRPGVTGCGLYLAWPVFFTDITNTYRMGRGGRLRADFGGVYFNGVFLLGLTVAYVASGRSPFLLVAILSTSLEAAQQLLPTLRFDGYYIIADLVGIPDLFKYIGPIIRRVLLRRPDDGRLAALKRWPQTVVTVWVLLVVPVLIGQLSLLAYNLPGIARSDWTGVQVLASHSLSGGNPVLGVLSAAVQILLLLFPLAGMALIALRMLRGLVRMIVRRLHVAGIVNVASLAGVWGVSWFLGIQESRDDDAAPAPRRRGSRPGVIPVTGAVVALGLAVILAWTLLPSSGEGNAAELQPNKVVGALPTGRPARPGHTPPASPSGYPGSGHPGKAGARRPGSSGYGSSRVPSSSARWSPEATGPSQASPSGASPSGVGSASLSQSGSPSGSQSPSGSRSPSGSQSPSGSRSPSGARSPSSRSPGSGSPSRSGSPKRGTSQTACKAPVGGMLLTLVGLCSH